MRKIFLITTLALVMACSAAVLSPPSTVFAAGDQVATTHDVCGVGKNAVKTSIDIGCQGKGDPVVDMAFAIIRFLSAGVGLVIVGSIIWGGMQYIGSRDDPNSVALAVGRIRSSVIALIIFIFAFAILNYIIPKGFIFR